MVNRGDAEDAEEIREKESRCWESVNIRLLRVVRFRTRSSGRGWRGGRRSRRGRGRDLCIAAERQRQHAGTLASHRPYHLTLAPPAEAGTRVNHPSGAK